MKLHTTNYKNTFIETSEDIPVSKAEIPPVKRNRTLADIQFVMITEHPYKFTSDDVMFECYAQKNDISLKDRADARRDFFSKGQACFRSSALAKRYGFGIHHNSEGKVAIFPMEGEDYKNLVNDDAVTKVKAMRNKRK